MRPPNSRHIKKPLSLHEPAHSVIIPTPTFGTRKETMQSDPPAKPFMLTESNMENARKSKVKKARKSGFRAKMRTKGGKKALAKRRKGMYVK